MIEARDGCKAANGFKGLDFMSWTLDPAKSHQTWPGLQSAVRRRQEIIITDNSAVGAARV